MKFSPILIKFCNVSLEIFEFEGVEFIKQSVSLKIAISPAPVLLFKLEKLSESCESLAVSEKMIPGGAAKF